MHISDGILTNQWCIIWYAVTIAFAAVGVWQIKKRAADNLSYMPMLALMGSAVFIIAVWHIPVPVTGSCSHPIGTPMSSIIVGPFATVILTMISLLFHAFLAHGGITTIGANTISMGIVGGFSGYLVYIGSRRANAPIWLAAGLAGFVGDVLCYVTTALELALSLNPGAVMYHWSLYAMGFIPTQLPLAIVEFIFTAAIINYITTVRPDLLSKIKSIKGGGSNGR